MSNKRQHQSLVNYDDDSDFDESDFDESDFDENDSTYAFNSSSDSDEEESEDPSQTLNLDPIALGVPGEVKWKDLSSTFVPRMAMPEYKDPQTNCNETDSILDVFFKLIPRSFYIWTSHCTNKRLEILAQKTKKKIKPTDCHEIMIVFGCLLVMSFNRVPHMWMYWSSNKSLRNETIASAISLKRFMLISSKLYFNIPTKPDGARKDYYMEELVNCLKYTFNRARSESTFQSIDESMIKFKGRSAMKQFMPKKPEKLGIKAFGRADARTGYMYDFNVYTGKETEAMEGTLGERVVKTLTSTIRESAVAIIVDRFFTSVTLLQTLPFSCAGTVMSNRKNLPDMTGKLQRGDSKAKCTNDGIICYKWQDTKEVTLLSNFHKHVMETADRRQNDGSVKTFNCPAAICFYNEHMAGVDKADQYSTIYSIDRKSNKWWKRVFHRLLMVAVSNAWILYKQFREKHMPLIDFLVPLAEDLIDAGKSGTKNLRNAIAGRPTKKSKPMVNVAHQRIKGRTRRRCRQCSKNGIQVRTLHLCNACEIPLCVGCFDNYHTTELANVAIV